MGNKLSQAQHGSLKYKSLPPKDVQKLVAHTHFTEPEIQWLYHHFVSISNSIEADSLIDCNEFQQALGMHSHSLSKRIFTVFDENGDGKITFSEFIRGISQLTPDAGLDKKLHFSFRLFDLDDDGYIDKEELFQMLKESLFENIQIKLSEEQMRIVVDNTFREVDANGDGKISYEEYRAMVTQRPSFVEYLTVRIVPSKEEYDLTNQLSTSPNL